MWRVAAAWPRSTPAVPHNGAGRAAPRPWRRPGLPVLRAAEAGGLAPRALRRAALRISAAGAGRLGGAGAALAGGAAPGVRGAPQPLAQLHPPDPVPHPLRAKVLPCG